MDKSRLHQSYENAEKLMPWNTKYVVLNGEPEALWLSDQVFCYAKQSRVKRMQPERTLTERPEPERTLTERPQQERTLTERPEPERMQPEMAQMKKSTAGSCSAGDDLVRTDFICHDVTTHKEWDLFDADALAGMLGEQVLPFDELRLISTVEKVGEKTYAFESVVAEKVGEKIYTFGFSVGEYDYEYVLKNVLESGCGIGSLSAKRHHKQSTSVVSPDGRWEAFVKDYNIYIKKAWNEQCEPCESILRRCGFERNDTGEYASGKSGDYDARALTFDGTEKFGYGGEAYQINVMRDRLSGIAEEAGILWSHDSKKLLTYKLDLRGVKDLYLLRTFDLEEGQCRRPEVISYPCSLPGDPDIPLAWFYIIDLERGISYPVQGPPVWVNRYVLNRTFMSAVWLEDDSSIYYTSTERGDRDGYFHIVDPQDGSVKTVIREHSDQFLNLMTYGLYSGFGAYPYSNFLTQDGKWIFWQSEREDLARIYRYDAATGEMENPVTPEHIAAFRILRSDEKEQWLYFMGGVLPGMSDPYYQALCRVHFDGSSFEILTPEDGMHKIQMGEKAFLDTWSRVDLPPVTVIHGLDGTFIEHLVSADISELLNRGYVMPERFHVIASDGKTELYGLLIRPVKKVPDEELSLREEEKAGPGNHIKKAPGNQAKDAPGNQTKNIPGKQPEIYLEKYPEKYPVIDYIYGGMQCTHVPKTFTWRADGGREMFGGLQAFAQLGIAGIMLDGLGTPGRGMAIHGVSYRNIHGCAGLKDHVTVRSQLAEKYPFLDFQRVGVWGNSGGACAAVRAMLEYPDDFQVAVASAGNHDQRMYDHTWTERYYGEYDPGIYQMGDNTALAKNLKGKLFLLHGLMDCNVSFAETMRLVDALIREDKDFDFLALPRANHNVPGDPYFIRKKLDYFVKHLLGEEPPEYHFSNIV